MVSPADLQAYVAVMRQEGVSSFRAGDLAIVLGPQPSRPAPRDPDAKAPAPRKTDYERLLFACTEGIADDQDELP